MSRLIRTQKLAKKSRSQAGLRGLFRPTLLLVLLLSFSLLGAAYFVLTREFPAVSILRTQYPRVTYLGAKKPPRVELERQRPSGWVPLSQISQLAVGAVVVSEDWAYFNHRGYDLGQIREAVEHDLSKGKFARGASTITQQVVRNVFLTKEKSLWRKFKELILATRLDRSVGKRRVLEVYLNIAEWGPGIFGIGAASQYYFGKHPSQLGAREGAFLAMLLPSPVRYSQSFRQKQLTRYAGRTVESILSKMVQASMITEEQELAARRERMQFELQGVSESGSDEPDEGDEDPPED